VDGSLKPAWTSNSRDPILQKMAGRVAQSISSEFKPQDCKKKGRRRRIKEKLIKL
jgi:hypothetical protein